MSKIIYYDLETTGLYLEKNGIHQISGCIEINNKVTEWFNFKVKPFETDEIEDTALEIGGVTREQINEYPEPQEIYKQFTAMLGKYVNKFVKTDKFHMVGFNNRRFDDNFLREFFTKNGDKYFGSWFWADTIDAMVLASEYLREERHLMVDFKLKTVAAYLGIIVDETKLHDARYDIELTRDIRLFLVDKMYKK